MNKLHLDELAEESVQGADLRSRLYTERIFSIKDAGINSKIFHVWKAKGLVNFVERGKWARLSFIEYLWLRLLESMRKFGCSVKLMKDVYEYFFTRSFTDKLAEKRFKEQYDKFKKLSSAKPLTYYESEILKTLESIKKNPIIMVRLRNEINYFYDLVFECLKYRTETGIIIFEDETFTTFSKRLVDENKESVNEIDNSRPHIYIPISSYILEFAEAEEKESFLAKTGLLTEDEYRVIKEIRNKNLKSITVTFSDNEERIEKIECDKKGQIKGEDAKNIMRLLGLKNYSGIKLDTRDGSTLSFTHTEKKFF